LIECLQELAYKYRSKLVISLNVFKRSPLFNSLPGRWEFGSNELFISLLCSQGQVQVESRSGGIGSGINIPDNRDREGGDKDPAGICGDFRLSGI
jgi:hypothetical protein